MFGPVSTVPKFAKEGTKETANRQGRMRKDQRLDHSTIASEVRGILEEKCKENKEFPFFFSSLLLSFSAFFLCFFFS